MIYLSVEQVEEGMVLAKPLQHPLQPGVVLLQAGCRLDSRSISLLPQYNVSRLWVQHADFEDLDRSLNPGVGELRTQLRHHLKAFFAGITPKSVTVDPKNDLALIDDLIKELSTDTQHAVYVARHVDSDDDLAGHSANTAYLSTVLGLWLRGYIVEQRKGVPSSVAMDLSNLVIGAVLHDVGKLGLDRSMQGVHHCDESKCTKDYRDHAERGYRLLQGRIEATASAAVLHHHQRYDGQGFPAIRSRQDAKRAAPLSGRAIHIFPRVVAVANTLDALFCAAHRDGRPLASALAALQSTEVRSMFDPVVLLTALQCVQPFPVASVVGLSDDRQAVVIEQNADKPCRPVVRTLDGGIGREARAKEELDLARPGAPTIACQGADRIDQYLYDISPELLRDAAKAGSAQVEVAVTADV